MRAQIATTLALASLLLLAAPLRAAEKGFVHGTTFEGPFQVVADEVEYDAARDVYVARGHVRITQQDKTLTADRVFFGNRTRIGIASGDVVVTEGGDTLTADFLQFDVTDLTGVVFQGRLESKASAFEMTGKEVQKTGPKTYVFRDGRFTTCQCPKPTDRDPWTITAGKAQLEIEGYARARNATLEVLGVPVLWTPYVVLPLKRERQSGFLMPNFGVSTRNGFELAVPFFWAARDNVNVLLTPQYLSNRGIKPTAELEYVFGERGGGQAHAMWIDDQEIDRNSFKTPFNSERWGGLWRHVMDLPADSWLAANTTLVSDNEVPFDFDDFQDERANRFLHSEGLTGTRFGPDDAFGVELAALYADDLQNPNDQDRDELLLQRLPQLTWSAQPTPVPMTRGLLASADVQYANFQSLGNPTQAMRDLSVGDLFYDTGADAIPNSQERQSNGVKVGHIQPPPSPVPDPHNDNGVTEGNGRFDEGEPLADHGNRVTAHPRIAYPLRIADAVELYPEVGWYGTFYDTALVGTEMRNLATARVDLRSQLVGQANLPYFGSARHLMEPHISWVYLSNQGQNDNPLFVPPTAVPQDRLRQLEPDNLILDPSDRLDKVDSLIFGVSNRLMGQRLRAFYAEFELSSEYRIEDTRWGPLVVQGEGRLPHGWWLRFHSSFDLDQGEFAEGLASAGWSHPYGHAVSFRYRYIRDIPRVFEAFKSGDKRFTDFSSGFLRVNQISGFGRVQLTHQWAFTYVGSFSFENALSLVNQFGIEYLSRCRCWAIRFEIEEDRVRGLSWNINYRLLGLGDDRDRPFNRPTSRRFDAIRGL